MFQQLSLKTRLIAAFAGVVVLSALLSAAVFTYELVSTMRKSTRDKVDETSKVALTHIDDVSKGLAIYADLIASDITFGQALSFDSSFGINQKIEEFKRLSGADLVGFLPRPEQYVQIKDEVFVNPGMEHERPRLKSAKSLQDLLSTQASNASRGWIMLGDTLFLYAAKPVLHFGANMGAIFLGRKCNVELVKEIEAAAGMNVTIFNAKSLFGTTLHKDLANQTETIPMQEALHNRSHEKFADENYRVGPVTYFSYFVPVVDSTGSRIATMGLQVSTDSISKARNQTIQRVLIVAALATLLSALIGFILARAISLPIARITKGIFSIIEKGDLGIRIKGTFGAEMGILTNSFNRLLGQLQVAHEKLAASERRMKNELTMASTVQEMLFPEPFHRYGKLELASFIESSTETGGDWFGYDQDGSGENVTVLIGDVTGHGMPAALITAIANGFFKGVNETENTLRELFRSEVSITSKHSLATSDMLSILNGLILDSTNGSLMMTFFASVFDSQKSELRYANAGHNRPLIYKSSITAGSKISVLPSEPAPRLGENRDVTFQENRIAVSTGDFIIWYTDGILECENRDGESYGKRRLLKVLNQKAGLSAAQIKDAIVADALGFFGEHPRKDDITLVVGKFV